MTSSSFARCPAAHTRGASSRVIDLTPRLRRERRQAILHTLLALWTQYLALGCLLLYALLRALLAGNVPLGRYSGPLVLFWPAAYFLLLASCCFDRLLWREEWASSGSDAPGAELL